MQSLGRLLVTLLLSLCCLDGAVLHILVTDPQGEPLWTRLEVRGAKGTEYQPDGALQDKTARNRPGGQPFYLGSFVVRGECRVTAPAGEYTVIAEHGPEYERVSRTVTLSDDETQDVTIRLAPWIRMNERGWYSADMHVHRPIDDAAALSLAEDLNLNIVFTMWNKRNLWDERSLPAETFATAAPGFLVSLMNAEDERGGGAWMFQNIERPLELGVEGRWYPPGLKFIRQVRAARENGEVFPWFDCEKPVWWEVPVVMALNPPDSFGVLHNHFNQYGIHDSEAWGRPRDTKEFPGWEGFVRYSLSLYYRYLNLGFRLPPSAGSASGVLPNPVGYNRMYARLDGKFTPAAWYEAVHAGRVFVTNGPMLLLDATREGKIWKLSVDVRAREPIDRIEVVANGEIVRAIPIREGAKTYHDTLDFDPAGHSWFAVRCFSAAKETIRLAHSAPVYLNGEWDATADARYFTDWIDELIGITRSDEGRFASEEERDEMINLYREARRFYEGKLN